MRLNAKPLVLFTVALFAYVFSAWNNLYNVDLFDQSKQEYATFQSSLNQQLRLKAGALIASNNLSPLLDKTLLRIVLGLSQEQIRGYRYTIENGFEVNVLDGNSVILLSDVVNYVDLTPTEGSSWVRVEGI